MQRMIFISLPVADVVRSTAFYEALGFGKSEQFSNEYASAMFWSFESRDAVDAFTQAAVNAGGRELHEPEDQGFMYSRAFEDLDGHGFGPFWMNPAAIEGRPPAQA